MADWKIQGKRLTQRQLSKVLGITEQNFCNKLRKDAFSVEEMLKITDYLGMTVVIKDKDGDEYEMKKGE